MLDTHSLIQARKTPFSQADIRLHEGEQGMGKSNTAVGRVVEDVLRQTAELYIKGKGIQGEVLHARDIVKVVSGKVTILAREAIIKVDGGKRRIVIAKEYPLAPVNIFCNFHLYGLQYRYCSFAQMIEGLADGTIHDGWLIIDQAEIGGDAREGMKLLARTITKYGFQFRKRRLHVIMLYPSRKVADWRFRSIFSETVSCSYNQKTHEITLYIWKRGEKKERPPVTYWAPQYWPYYDTEELIGLPEGEVARAIQAAM